MKQITVKNLTKGLLILGSDVSINEGESKSFGDAEYTTVSLTADAFHSAGMVQIVVSEGDVESNADSAVAVETAEAKKKIKEQLAELQKEFRNPKTDSARKEQIGLEVAELKEQASKLK